METFTFTRSQAKRCPFCAEIIQAEAIKCRFCNEFINTDKPKAVQSGCKTNSQSPEDAETSDNVLFEARPSLWAMTGAVIKGLFFFGIAVLLLTQPVESILNNLLGLKLTEKDLAVFGSYRTTAGVGLAVLVVMIWFLKAVWLKSIRYKVSADRIEWSRGIFDRKIDNLDMFRVIDLKLRRGLLDCVLGIGSVGLMTTDKTDPEFIFEKVHNSRKLYDIIKKASLEADKQRGVIHVE